MMKHTAKLIFLCAYLAVCFFQSWKPIPVNKNFLPIGDTITGIQVVSHYEVVYVSSGKKEILKDTFFIFYRNNYMLCQMPYTQLEPDYKRHQLVPAAKRYYYFVRHKDSAKGMKFYDLKEIKGLYCVADSFLNENAFMAGDYSNVAFAVPYNVTKREDIEIKKYVWLDKVNTDNPDTAVYTFSKKLITVPYTFSKLMDSVNNAKLTSILLLYNRRYYKKYKKTAPPRKLYVGFMVLDRIKNYAQIDAAFNEIEQSKL